MAHTGLMGTHLDITGRPITADRMGTEVRVITGSATIDIIKAKPGVTPGFSVFARSRHSRHAGKRLVAGGAGIAGSNGRRNTLS